MIFSWLKRRRRKKILSKPFPRRWARFLSEYLPVVSMLSRTELLKLEADLKIFIAEKNWEGCRGLEVTDEVRVIIGAQACLLVLGLDVSRFDHVQTILVYPAEYYAEARRVIPDGTVSEDVEGRLGEAWYRGPVVLSWADTLHGCLHPLDGMNVAENGIDALRVLRVLFQLKDLFIEFLEDILDFDKELFGKTGIAVRHGFRGGGLL